jgi:hypothetical protein
MRRSYSYFGATLTDQITFMNELRAEQMRWIFAVIRFIICYSPYKKYRTFWIYKTVILPVGIPGFFGVRLSSCIIRTQRFGNCICFHPQVRGWETPTPLVPFSKRFGQVPGSIHHWQNHFESTSFFPCLLFFFFFFFFAFTWNLMSHTREKSLGLKMFRTSFRKRYFDSRRSDKVLEKSEWGAS